MSKNPSPKTLSPLQFSESMASTIFSTMLNNSRNLKPRTATLAFISLIRTCHTGAATTTTAKSTSSNLFSRFNPISHPDDSVVQVLDQWVQEGKKIKNPELQRIIRELRSRRRYKHALEVSEWMSGKELHSFSSSDCAVQLELIGRVRGLESAERYFGSVTNQDKIGEVCVFGALLSCYTREGLVAKSLSLVQKMKESDFTFTALNYNDLMCLYKRTGELEKVPEVLSDMKDKGVFPDNFSYRICINSYGLTSDFNSMEKVLHEMECQPHISMDWTTYSMVGSFYVKGGLKEKSLFYLNKCEKKVFKDALGYNHLISLHAGLGNKEEMKRLWNLQKVMCKKQINRDFINMLGSLVRLGELEEAEMVLKEWSSVCKYYDFRVPNVLLIGYCEKGLVEKAEKLLHDIVKKRKTASPNSWAIIAAGFADKHNMEKACECFEEALAVHAENKGWRPKPSLIIRILSWLTDKRDLEALEAFGTNLLKTKVQIDKQIYHALIKTYIRCGKKVDLLLESMKTSKIDEDGETKMILKSR